MLKSPADIPEPLSLFGSERYCRKMNPTPPSAQNFRDAPPLEIAEWFNTSEDISLESLHGRVVVLYAFQMLCPGCVITATPLAKRIHERLAGPDLALIGLHTVFEHHTAMTPVSLKAYLHEFAVGFPVGVDNQPDASPLPATMSAFEMRGTPTFILIDRAGQIRRHFFGGVDELVFGAEIGLLLSET
jgi:peroxiredoxin